MSLSREFMLELNRRNNKKTAYRTKVLSSIAFIVSIFIISFGGPILITFLFILL